MRRPRFPTHEAEERLAQLRAAGSDTVALHGTPSPSLPAHVRDAVAAALAGPQLPAPARGLVALREALAGELHPATGRDVDPATELVVTNGAMHALGLVFRALLEPGDEVVVPGPCFFFEGPIASAGGTCIVVSSAFADGWAWDLDALEHAIGPRTRALLLCTPGNPTGRVHTADEVRGAVALAERHDLVVIADEAYEAARFDGATLASPFAVTERCLLVRSLGKSLSLPQLRVGLVAGPAALVERVAVELEWDVLRVGLPPQAAALAALDGPRAWLEDVRLGLEADRDAALGAVAATSLRVARPGGGPFLFVGEGHRLAERLLTAGLPVVDGRHFRAPGWARLPIGGAAAARTALDDALARAGAMEQA